MDDLGHLIGAALFVGLVFGTYAFMGAPKEQRTAGYYFECFFSAIVAMFILGALWFWIGRWAGYN